jgi:hypothetical protein
LKAPTSHPEYLLGLMSVILAFALTTDTGDAKPTTSVAAVSGVSIHHCSCVVGCPCMFGPQLSDCRMVMVHHVDNGSMQGHKLDGATVVTLLPNQKDLAAKPAPRFRAAVYVDNRFSPEAQKVLVRMFTPEPLRKGKQLLATPTPIRFRRTQTGFHTDVPGYLQAETKARVGRDGKQLVVHNVNFAEGSVWRVGENVSVKVKEPLAGWTWDLTGRNGTWTVWKWQSGKGHRSVLPGQSAIGTKKQPATCSCCL